MEKQKVFIEVPVREKPEADGIYTCIKKDRRMEEVNFAKEVGFFDAVKPDKIIPISASYYTHWLKPITAHVLTDEDLRKLRQDAWEAACNHNASLKNVLMDLPPTKEEYLNK